MPVKNSRSGNGQPFQPSSRVVLILPVLDQSVWSWEMRGAAKDGSSSCRERDHCRVRVRRNSTWRVGWYPPTGRAMEVQGILVFLFEGGELVCEKVYFDHASILG